MSSGVISFHPYPYLVQDDFLPAEMLQNMRRNWPGEGNFYAEIPGNYVCNITQFMGEGFWFEFSKNITSFMSAGVLAQFAEYLEARYPGERTYYVVLNSVMQSKGNYGGHDVHNHHYHNPCFAATILLYMDTVAEGHSGTTILKTVTGMDEATVAAQTLDWRDLTEEHATVDYKSGRMFAFHDNAIAYHSVKGSVPPARFGRRVYRLHVSASDDWCEKIYGVGVDEYQKRRIAPTSDPLVVGWMRKDIEMMKNVRRTMSDGEREAWRKSLEIGVLRIKPEDVAA